MSAIPTCLIRHPRCLTFANLRRHSRRGKLFGWGLGALLLSQVIVAGAAPLRAVVVTNYVVVTNIVLTTNFVAEPLPDLPPATPPPPSPPPVSPSLTAPQWPSVDSADPSFDWIQLKSGEWLKGRIRALQDESLDFDSEELDDQTFDWKDVRQLRSGGPVVVEFLNQTRARGPVQITPEQISIGGEFPGTYPRKDLFGLTPGGGSEWDHWTAKLSAGLNVRTGNSDQTDYNARVDLLRRTTDSRFSLEYVGAITRVDGSKTEDSHRLNTEFDFWVSRRLFLRTPFFEYFRDPFQNLSHRVTAGAGVGYDLFDRPRLEWSVTAGPAYQQAWFESVAAGEAAGKTAAALVFGSRLEYDLTKRIDLTLDYRGQFTRRAVGETTHHAEIRFEFEITKRLDLDLSLVWDRISQPRETSAGTTPQPDDFRIITTVGLEF